jgi:hypothetical protein
VTHTAHFTAADAAAAAAAARFIAATTAINKHNMLALQKLCGAKRLETSPE